MPTESERIFYRECWPAAVKNVLKNSIGNGDARGVAGLSSFAVCIRKATDYEAAVTVLVREILNGFDEAKEIRERLAREGIQLKEDGTYELQERLAGILEEGLIPSARLSRIVQGYRREAREIYLALKSDGFLRLEKRRLRSDIECIGLNANWNDLLEDIRIRGMNKEMWSSSVGVILSVAETGKGITKIIPMALGVLEAGRKDGKITFDELYESHFSKMRHGKKELEIILERQREKIDPLKIFPSDTGGMLITNPNSVYAVEAVMREANRLFRMMERGM